MLDGLALAQFHCPSKATFSSVESVRIAVVLHHITEKRGYNARQEGLEDRY
jgi:hypothetical protein